MLATVVATVPVEYDETNPTTGEKTGNKATSFQLYLVNDFEAPPIKVKTRDAELWHELNEAGPGTQIDCVIDLRVGFGQSRQIEGQLLSAKILTTV
jgi:hypothetical protein